MAALIAVCILAVILFVWSLAPLLKEREETVPEPGAQSEGKTAFAERELETDFKLDRIAEGDLAAFLHGSDAPKDEDEEE